MHRRQQPPALAARPDAAWRSCASCALLSHARYAPVSPRDSSVQEGRLLARRTQCVVIRIPDPLTAAVVVHSLRQSGYSLYRAGTCA